MITVTAADRLKYRSYTDGSIFGIKVIKALPTDLLQMAKVQGSNAHEALRRAIGEHYRDDEEDTINPSWVTEQVAEELCFGRCVIELEEFDALTR
jgi:hypothetical protein